MRAGPVGRSRPVTSRRTAFRIVAAAFAVTMSGTTLPTPLYPLYQRAMGFSTLTTTVVFAAYAVGVLTALLLAGRASDVIGRRRTLQPVTARSPRELRITRLAVPASMRTTFVGAAVAGFASFAVLGLFTAVTPLFLRTLLAVPGPAPAGLLVCWLLVASTFGQAVLVPRLRAHAMPVGSATLTLGALALAGALAVGSLPLLLVATTLAGLGQGTTFRAALALLTAASPPDRRAEVASSFFVVAYVAISAPVVGEGLAAQLVGLRTAGVGFGVAVGILAAVATARFRSTAPPTP